MPEHNEPKIAPTAMNISETAMETMLAIGHIMTPSMVGEATTEELRNFYAAGVVVIEKHTNLTPKEDALRELVEVHEDLDKFPSTDHWDEDTAGQYEHTLARHEAALEKAKKALGK